MVERFPEAHAHVSGELFKAVRFCYEEVMYKARGDDKQASNLKLSVEVQLSY